MASEGQRVSMAADQVVETKQPRNRFFSNMFILTERNEAVSLKIEGPLEWNIRARIASERPAEIPSGLLIPKLLTSTSLGLLQNSQSPSFPSCSAVEPQ